jgi:hypothetical protein
LYCRISELERLSVEKTKVIYRIITERDALQARLDVAEAALKKLSRLGNEPLPGNSIGNRIAQDALKAIAGDDDV